jgi:putative N6-adenine-specific DNA methylase
MTRKDDKRRRKPARHGSAAGRSPGPSRSSSDHGPSRSKGNPSTTKTGSLDLFAACLPGLEPWLEEEVRSLEPEHARAVAGGVELRGGRALLYRCLLELGLASHVLVRVGSFSARSFAELVDRTAALDWERFIDPAVPTHIRARCRESRLYHTGAVAERVRRGIGQAVGQEPPEGTHGKDVAVHVRIAKDHCTLSLDATGAPLHRRGYRQEPGKAPLREDLARAAVRLSGWNGQSPLLDPLMGAGTIPIEAALFARRLPPGAHRSFALETTPLFDPAQWRTTRDDALSRAHPDAPPIAGSDRDAGAVRAALANAQRAGVDETVTFEEAPLSGAPTGAFGGGTAGALVTHPPFGGRLGEGTDLRPLYQSLGRLAGELPQDTRVALVVRDRRLALSTRLQLDTALLTDHGGTKVRIVVGSSTSSRQRGPRRRPRRNRHAGKAYQEK